MRAARNPVLNKQALYRDLGYEPHPGQLAVHSSTALRRVLACGVRWGKTTCAAMEGVSGVLAPAERSVGWVVAPTYDLSNRIFHQIEGVLSQRLPHRLVEVDPREHKILVCNLGGGLSELRAKSADHVVSLLGEGLDWLIVDEAARLKASVWESHLSQRLIDRGGWALLLSTPAGANWFFRLYRRGQGRDSLFASWNCPSWTNPHLNAEWIEQEKGRLPDEVFRQEYGAEFLGEDTNRCESCGSARRDGPGLVLLEVGDELVRCLDCEGPVDGEGRALGRLAANGKAYLKIIDMSQGESLQTETPSDQPIVVGVEQ